MLSRSRSIFIDIEGRPGANEVGGCCDIIDGGDVIVHVSSPVSPEYREKAVT